LFTPHPELYEKINQIYPGEVVYANSLRGFLLFFRTKNVIISYGTSAAAFKPFYLHEKCKNIIYMGHGTPVKRIGLQTPVWRKHGKKFQLQKYSYLTACSDVECLMLASGFDVELDRIWITGLPRTDYLLNPKIQNPEILKNHPYLEKKIILYAPTWREYGYKTQFFPFKDFDAKKIEDFLEQNDAYILIRGHKEDIKRNSLNKEFDIFSIERVLPAEQAQFPDVNQLLPFVDQLVTDYSSILVDFLLLNRPVCFLPYDLEQYNSYKGILLDYEKTTPGAKAFTQEEFLNHLKIYMEKPQTDEKWRQEVCDMYHHHQDGKSCERIYQRLKEICL
jgi:CDP-glycerol glycerophosphotransferase (TagB/SpsB family)